MIRLVVFSLCTVACCRQVVAQHLTFTKPQSILSAAMSDKAPSLIRFNEQYVTAWKDTGAVGQLHVSYLGLGQNAVTVIKHVTIPGAMSAFTPVLQVGHDHLYLFWVGPDGRVQYARSTSQTGFDQASVFTINRPEPFLTGGISVTFLDQTFILAAHANEKDRLILAAWRVNHDGILEEPTLIPAKGARSDNMPVITALDNGSVARLSWIDHKKRALYYADYTPANRAWQAPQVLADASNVTAMALYPTQTSDQLFWIWKDNVMDGCLRYLEETDGETPEAGMVLPAYKPSILHNTTYVLFMMFRRKTLFSKGSQPTFVKPILGAESENLRYIRPVKAGFRWTKLSLNFLVLFLEKSIRVINKHEKFKIVQFLAQ